MSRGTRVSKTRKLRRFNYVSGSLTGCKHLGFQGVLRFCVVRVLRSDPPVSLQGILLAIAAKLMGRFQAVQQLTRCARRLVTADSSSLIPARLLSNSQASTSAVDGSEFSHSPAGRRDAQKRQPREQPQRSRDTGAKADFQADDTKSLKETELSDASDEFEPGFVPDGAYPYAASEVEVTHLGGSTETAWEFLGSADEQAVTWFGMDFTRGTHPEVERNALLSNEAKEMMYQMHKHDDKRCAHKRHISGYACVYQCCVHKINNSVEMLFIRVCSYQVHSANACKQFQDPPAACHGNPSPERHGAW